MILLDNSGSWTGFSGRMHPVLVHLPIGILVAAIILLLLSRRARWQSLQAAVPSLLLLAFLSAVTSCITGYLLSKDGGYEESLLNTHFYLGITVAVSSGIFWICWRILRRKHLLILIYSFVMLSLITITGHYGGSLTHGDNYLTAALPPALSKFVHQPTNKATPAFKDISDARVYEDLVQPVLNTRCVNCHSQQKLKGGLQLESLALIRKGGENGPVLKDSLPEESEIYKRLLLAEEDEHRMPPKGKPSLSPAETELLYWWIANGAPAGKKVKDIPKNTRIQAVLAAMQPAKAIDQLETVPQTTVAAAAESAIAALTAKGLKVLPVGANSNYLSVSAFTAPTFGDKDIHLLLPLKTQLIWLDLSDTQISDQSLETLGQLQQLTRLTLKGTPIKGDQLRQLNNCRQLMYLNLGETAVTDAALVSLKQNKKLQQLYVNKLKISATTVQQLTQEITGLKIDTGGYRLPVLASDTIVYHKQMN
ncbi:MAG: hypothetical protein JO154_08405 [Chitinophaga sp.]|uniref:c-type cytochrome domain-containing protein n=1 Tax=Chitinophaga sp. TaxID=1869181 RepID=UPI0025C4C758|nr:c-type cytochrome domain-containing protein [Chitinophaga sp.]MBV8252614.1 hypothetical protein [Chitinophaga sp.]